VTSATLSASAPLMGGSSFPGYGAFSRLNVVERA